ncbi:MAG: putative sulfate exporter family transporter [Actinomycetota bacterium]|nr:putative sulfate exporter family transporter [Actinomycetota bacterium]
MAHEVLVPGAGAGGALGVPAGTAAARRSFGLPGAGAVLPGLLVVAFGTAVALIAARVVPGLHASTGAVALGALLANAGLHRPLLHAGTQFASGQLLRIAVVLLGLQLAVPQLFGLGVNGALVVAATVTVTFCGTRLLGRLLGVPPARTLLIATGFSICGASAIAAMKEVADGDEDDTAVAIALVTLYGSLAIVLLPLLQGPLGLSTAEFGSWVGASVHDLGQTVATAEAVPGALAAAVVVKLSRVVLLAPLVTGVAMSRSRRLRAAGTDGLAERRPPRVPLFVAGFLAAIAVNSAGLLPAPALTVAGVAQQVTLVAALVGLGTGIRFSTLRRTGGRALLLGLASWVLVATVAYAGVRVLA